MHALSAIPGISPELFWRLDKAADAVNPLLTLWAVLVLVRHTRGRGDLWRVARVWLSCIVVVYVTAHLNRWLHLWAGHKYFPSGHASYFGCVATLGAALERRSPLLTAPLLALYSLLMVQMGYHSWLDIAGAVVLAPLLTLAILRLASRSRADAGTVAGPVAGPVAAE